MSLLGIIASSKKTAGPVAGYKLWLDAADTSTITASGGDVSQWNDKSGFGNNFTQATGANQPKTGTRTINSKNVLDFDGSTDFMSCPSSTATFKFLHSSTGGTMFVVGLIDDTVGGGTIMGTANFSSAQIGVCVDVDGTEQTNTAIVRGVSGNSTALAFTVNTLTPGAAFYLTSKLDGGNATAANRIKESLNAGSFNGANTLSNAASTANSTANLTFGADGSGAVNYNGVFGEVIIYEGILSNDDITANKNYLAAKWGI